MADSLNNTSTSRLESRGHPTDEMYLSLSRAQGVMHLLECNFEGTKENGAFRLPDWLLYHSIFAASRLVDEAFENLERLQNDRDVGVHTKAEVKP
jgi:hypothetical protein